MSRPAVVAKAAMAHRRERVLPLSHRPPRHVGGGGRARAHAGVGDVSSRQGTHGGNGRTLLTMPSSF